MPRSPATALPSAVPAREALALNMIRLRGELGWSQEDLAYEAGLHRTFVAHVSRRSAGLAGISTADASGKSQKRCAI